MTDQRSDQLASLLSELLLYHSFLGRGYHSPFPATRGLVYASALPQEAMDTALAVELRFRDWHYQRTAEDRKLLEELKGQPTNIPGVAEQRAKLEAKLGKFHDILWTGDTTDKATMIEIIKKSQYGAVTHADPQGTRIGGKLSGPALNHALGWVSLCEGSADQTFIRAGATGGALVHRLGSKSPVFNLFCNCQQPIIEVLADRVKNSSSGQSGIGTTILVPGERAAFSGVSEDLLYSLTERVYALGEDDEGKKWVNVTFEHGASGGWGEFLNWDLPQLIEQDDPSPWAWRLARKSPASVENSILFAARAAMVAAFIEHAGMVPGPFKEVTLTRAHLEMAKDFARLIYRRSSGHEGYEDRIKHLKPAGGAFLTEQKLDTALLAVREFLDGTDHGQVTRNQVARQVKGATLGQLDELVRRGDLAEVHGDDVKIGHGCKQAYTLPMLAPPIDVDDAIDEFREARDQYRQVPEDFDEGLLNTTCASLEEKAAHIFNEHFLPVVPLTRMSKVERRMLPMVMEKFPMSMVLRGVGTGLPEPQDLLEDEDTPLDVTGMNLWVRHRPDGRDYCNWKQSTRLGLADRWGRPGEAQPVVPEDGEPPVVPADEEDSPGVVPV